MKTSPMQLLSLSANGVEAAQLLPAMKRVLSLKRTDGLSRTMVVVTDGYVMVEEEVQ